MGGRQVLLAAALATLAPSAPGCALSVAMEQWPPYVYLDARDEPAGLDLELARAILQEAGCSLRILPELPTVRRQRLFELGDISLLLAATDTPERQRLARFSSPYRYESVAVFTTAGKLARYRKLGSMNAIARQRVGLLAPRAGWYGRAYEQALPALTASGQLSTFNSVQQGMRMLAAGRADLILGDTGALRHEARLQGVTLAPLPFTVLRAPVHLMLNRARTTAAELDAINAAIARLEQQGTLAAIRARYDTH